MNEKTKQKLSKLTCEFYSKAANSFSETRQNAWSGWKKVLQSVDVNHDYELLDVACGNLRFEKFLIEINSQPAYAICIDNCESLLPDNQPSFVEVKKVDLLSCDFKFNVDFAVCFGFMHHIPSASARREFLLKLLDSVKTGGFVAISFWQFMKDEKIARKAVETTARALKKHDLELEEGDFLLGWQEREDIFRYCHNFEDSEIEAMVSELGDRCALIDQFSEDGKSHNLNKYVILKRQ